MQMYAIGVGDSYKFKYYTYIGSHSQSDYWSMDVKDASLWLSYSSAQMNMAYLQAKFASVDYYIVQVEIN